MFRHVLVHAGEYPSLAQGQAWPGLLSPREEAILAGLAYLPRRRKWLLGRVAAKRLVRAMADEPGLDVPDDAISVLNHPSGEPFVVIEGRGDWTRPISLSHRSAVGLAAAPLDRARAIGADVETIEARDPALVRQFFTAGEATAIEAGDRDVLVARIWSAKEAALKVLGLGLRLDTRAVEVHIEAKLVGKPFFWCPAGWHPVRVKLSESLNIQSPPEPFARSSHQGSFASHFRVVWRREGSYVLTVALADQPPFQQ